ncbi:PucR family transcriptional regulator [Nocardioides nematodiphilus]|uniref:PucR family transcriptional regulator n=1 Tax=Nocardioides nematodiphilus TaxID=2849669 RepID=UPI001CD93612|nr:PucR family transcriptional regulator [Nocardioides nematodiphilus]MCA1981761.1 helix-turn-helix domain-containing protein [Nocardioides nematodiphilus]
MTRPPELLLPPQVVEALGPILPRVGEQVVAAVISEVPAYQGAWSDQMSKTIQSAVKVALGGFLAVASGEMSDAGQATPPAVKGAYELGRGEARSGRSTEALLAAYRIGARVAWRELSTAAVAAGLPSETLVELAALVFAWIDEVSDASVAGHGDELATAGRVRQQLMSRLGRMILRGDPPDALDAAAERASWERPSTLTAALVPAAQVGPVLAMASQATIVLSELSELDEVTLLLVPDVHGRARGALLRVLEGRDAVCGPAKPWRDARISYERAMRARDAGLGLDTDKALVALVLDADPEARADLRAAVLAPLADLRPSTAEKLTETLRSWLLHQGRREEIASELFVHPQTVRYRIGQLREVYGDKLEDPKWLLALTVALG